MQNRTLGAFYINAGVREAIPIYPLYAVMFGEHGVSPIELSLLFILWSLVCVVAEVPSGALADRFSRKWLVIAGGITKSASFLAWYFMPSLPGYALGFVLWGLGSTMRSGALEALLHDVLRSFDREAEFTRHYGRIRALGTLGVVVAQLAGGLLVMQGYTLVLLASVAISLLATVPLIVAVSEPPRHRTASSQGYIELVRSGLNEAVSNRAILYILITCSLLIVSYGILEEYVGPILAEKGFSPSVIAFLMVPIAIAQALGYWLAGYFHTLTLPRLLMLMAGSSMVLLLVPSARGYYIPLVLLLFCFVFGIAATLFQAHLQSEISGAARATVTSTVGLGENFGGIAWYLAFGLMAQQGSMSIAAAGVGAIIIVLCALSHWLARRWQITRPAA